MDQNHWISALAKLATITPTAADKAYLTSIGQGMLAFAIITTICIVTISIPQLVKLIKEKQTGEVSFFSFWFFQYGILFWVIYAAFNPGVSYNDAAGKMTISGYLPTLVGETITIVINGTMLFLLHYYKKGMARWKVWLALGFILFNWAVTIAVFVAHFTTPQCFYYVNAQGEEIAITQSGTYAHKWYYIPRFSDTASFVLGFIGPIGVTLPFTPQLIKSIRTKQWQGVSVWLFVLYTVNNVAWLIFFSLGIQDQISMYTYGMTASKDGYWAFVGSLVWQCIGFVLFTIQLVFTVDDIIKRKKGLRTDAVVAPAPKAVEAPVSVENEMLIE